MSTQLESWKYFEQENVQKDEAGEITLGTLPGSVDECKPSFSVGLMCLQGIMGAVGFFGVVKALRDLKDVFDTGMMVEAMKKMQPQGLDAASLAMAKSQQEWMMLIITCVIIKIMISCGFMGAAVMLKQRVDHANWFASLICFGAIIYNLLDFGLQYMMLPDLSKSGLSAQAAETFLAGILIFMAVVFFIKMAIYLGLMVFLNNKTNKAIFAPRDRKSIA